MSDRHPIVAITGSSGAGTTSVTHVFENIFRREGVKAAIVEGDSFHRFDRAEMKLRSAEAERDGNRNFSHFGPENNLFAELEQLFHSYGECGQGRARKYLHDAQEAAPIAFLMEQAGGRASTGRQPMLGVRPTSLDQRIGLVFGARRGEPPVRRAQPLPHGLSGGHDVGSPPHHRHHRLLRRRHDLGDARLREHFPPRGREGRDRRGR